MPQIDIEARVYYNKQYHEANKRHLAIRAEQLAYGLEQEKEAMPVINHFFNDNIAPTAQYCSYDFTGLLTKNLYELKSAMYPLAQYPTVVLDLQKVRGHRYTPSLFFVFSFKEATHKAFYYIRYDYERFCSFPTRHIALRRGGMNEVVDIPKSALVSMSEI
jgi:hypothetical protein